VLGFTPPPLPPCGRVADAACWPDALEVHLHPRTVVSCAGGQATEEQEDRLRWFLEGCDAPQVRLGPSGWDGSYSSLH
jgi:hypothetical protein